ncbi:XisI protein [Anabaena cylindrica UHCC 0172]|uniref:XisI protein n=1 Tax=Anabaena cylindrica TaxID=1165 RepID=UPI002B220221|nr:XisI protein [Anabaena cylindrica]MEA5552095.1 XisI protein [Anabaena cylindrica UHCC 0172]
MDTLDNYRCIIKEVLVPYTQIAYSYGVIECKTVFDSENDSYLLITIGWQNAKRIHGCLVHIDIIDGKIWVQRDDTEDGVTYELEAAGIPKDKIVLGFHPQNVRQYTGYAVI